MATEVRTTLWNPAFTALLVAALLLSIYVAIVLSHLANKVPLAFLVVKTAMLLSSSWIGFRRRRPAAGGAVADVGQLQLISAYEIGFSLISIFGDMAILWLVRSFTTTGAL